LKTSSGSQIRRASLAPGAMGESRQVNNDKSAEGQAENRRVVVRVLQNKAIAGI
jgi:OmpA-OmpF porin, OOP family